MQIPVEHQAGLQLEEPDAVSACLFRNTQFIYEFLLAGMELRSLGARYTVGENLNRFHIKNAADGVRERILRRSAYVQEIAGRRTDYAVISAANVTRSVNQYLTHWIYPYKGKFHPQMVRALLNILELRPGDWVLDPFIGSGTTAVEAQLLGIHTFGIDASPLCVLQSRVKTQSIEVADLLQQAVGEFLNGLWIEPEDLRKFVRDRRFGDTRVANFFRLAELMTLSDSRRRRRNPERALQKNLQAMLDSVQLHRRIRDQLGLTLGKVALKVGDARALPLKNESVDGILTSPPYSIALDYLQNDAHALHRMGVDAARLREQILGLRGRRKERLGNYNQDLFQSYKEMARVLKPEKMAAVIIGNARLNGTEVQTVEFTVESMEKLGFRLEQEIDKVIFGLYNVMKSEKILIFRKIRQLRI